MVTLRAFILVMSIIGLRHAALNAQLIQVDVPPAAVPEGGTVYPDALIAVCVLFCVAAKLLAVLSALHAEVVGRSAAGRRFASLRGGLEWAWILMHALAVPASKVTVALVGLEASGSVPSWTIVLWFLPSLVFLSTLEYCSAELDLDMLVTEARFRRKNLAEGISPVPTTSLQSMWLQRLRLGVMGQVLTCAMPMWMVLAINDLLLWLAPALSEWMRLCISLGGLGVVCLTLAPLWMRWSIGARPLMMDDPLRKRFKQFCVQLNVTEPQLLVVGADGSWRGAGLVGWTPLFRQLWVGQALLTNLSDRQLDMLMLHELAHLKRGHCWWRIVPLLAVGVGLAGAINGTTGHAWQLEQQWSVLAIAAGLAWLLGWISRQCELDADCVACLQATAVCSWTDGRPTRAAEALASALTTLHDPNHSPESRYWLHPSLKSRLHCLTSSS